MVISDTSKPVLRTALLVVTSSIFIARPTAAFPSIAHPPCRHHHHIHHVHTTKSCLWIHGKEREEEEEDQVCCRFRQEMRAVDRRGCMFRLSSSIFGATAFSSSRPAVAVEETSQQEQQQRMVFDRRPVAPLGALLPATEQRMLLRECLMLSERLVAAKAAARSKRRDETTITTMNTAIQRLETILVNPTDEGSGGYNYYTRGLTEKKRTERDRKILSQYQQSSIRKLSGNIIRATMNIYISNLRYGKDYSVQDPEWKSAYIRANDGLPDFRKLIQADLDLRILYMNQVQIRVDDAAAEFYAVWGSGDNDNKDGGDAAELQRLLQLAVDSMDSWFELIDGADVSEASRAVAQGKSLKIVDNSYTAGFVPPLRE